MQEPETGLQTAHSPARQTCEDPEVVGMTTRRIDGSDFEISEQWIGF